MIKIDENYTDYRDDTDPKYPGGKAVNATTSEGADGTPLLADWMNDINGALQAIFIGAFGDINKVSGKPDNVQESDVLKAIKKITQDYTDRKNEVEAQTREQGDIDTLQSAKEYADKKTPRTFFNYTIRVPGAGWYRLAHFQNGPDGRGYISMTIRSGDDDLTPDNMTIFASAAWGGYDYPGGIVAICPYFYGNITQFRIVSNESGTEKYLEAYFSKRMWCNFHAEDVYYTPIVYGGDGTLPRASNDLTIVRNGYLKIHNGVCSSVDDVLKLFAAHVDARNNPHGVTKAQVGLGNVDNTADAHKSVKYATTAGSAKAAGGDADTVGGFHAGNGTGMLVPVTAFSVSGSTGYIKLGNGLLLQWGTTGVTPGNSIATVYFPVAFSSTDYSIASMAISASDESLTTHSLLVRTSSYVIVKRWKGAYFGAAAEPVWFIAIGI